MIEVKDKEKLVRQGEEMSEFNLSEERRKLFETMCLVMTKGVSRDIIDRIKFQDKEFIKRDWDLFQLYESGQLSLTEYLKKKTRLAGDELNE